MILRSTASTSHELTIESSSGHMALTVLMQPKGPAAFKLRKEGEIVLAYAILGPGKRLSTDWRKVADNHNGYLHQGDLFAKLRLAIRQVVMA